MLKYWCLYCKNWYLTFNTNFGILNAKKVAFKIPKMALKVYEMDPWLIPS